MTNSIRFREIIPDAPVTGFQNDVIAAVFAHFHSTPEPVFSLEIAYLKTLIQFPKASPEELCTHRKGVEQEIIDTRMDV